MFLIFEGPDGAGKTTLIQQLQEHLEGSPKVFHSTPPAKGKDKAVEFLAPLSEKDGAWLDRSWYSEMIYGTVMNGTSLIDVARRRVLERLYLAKGAIQIWCLPSYNTCLATWTARKKDEHVQDVQQFKQIYDLYVKHGRQPKLPTIRYDYQTCTVETLAGKLVDPRLFRTAHPNGPGVGCWNAGKSILLISHNPNLRGRIKNPGYLGPFCSWSKTDKWLSEQLELGGIPEAQLYWINASQQDGEFTEPAFLKALKPRAIVALGKEAAYWCEYIAELPFFHEVPHPSYWKLYRRKEPYPLIRELQSLTDVAHTAPALVF